jgi:hypothetical protein
MNMLFFCCQFLFCFDLQQSLPPTQWGEGVYNMSWIPNINGAIFWPSNFGFGLNYQELHVKWLFFIKHLKTTLKLRKFLWNSLFSKSVQFHNFLIYRLIKNRGANRPPSSVSEKMGIFWLNGLPLGGLFDNFFSSSCWCWEIKPCWD